MAADIWTVEQYEWLVYLFNGLTLLFVGLFLIGSILIAANSEKTLPTLIASLVCVVMSLYFFAEAFFTKNREEFSFDLKSLVTRR